MGKKAKKQAATTSFSIGELFNKITSAKPSTLLITVIVLGSALFLFSGIVFIFNNAFNPAVVNRLPMQWYDGVNFHFIFSRALGGSLAEQFGAETIISFILYTMGFAGLLVTYQSSKHAYNPRQAYMMLVTGVTLLIMAYLFLEYFIRIKMFA